MLTPAAPNAVIQGLWVGPELSVMEQLSISSFLMNGHQYHLYVYEDTKNIPSGTVIRDGNEILPSSRIFKYRKRPSFAGFSNFFRYKLLLERGGWWVDTDVVCLRPFDFASDHVFASESGKAGDEATCCVMKAPVGSPAMAAAWEFCQAQDTEQLSWGVVGPYLVRDVVRRLGLEGDVVSRQTFSPLDYHAWNRVLDPAAGPLFDDRAYAIHLFHEMWRMADQDKNAAYPPGCLYEQLKERYLTFSCYV